MKTYVIVGASKGIGRSLAIELIKDGHEVFNLSRSPSDIEGCVDIKFDVLEDTFPVDQLPSKIHGIAYCPGSINLKGFKTIKDELFISDFQINTIGAAKTLKAALPLLTHKETVTSIVLFSTVAVGIGMSFHASVAMAKGAVEGLGKSLAAELAPHVRVNIIAPSLTDTPLAAGLLASEERKQKSAEMHPLKRYGSADDIAKAAKFLITEESAWITGQILHVDGGLSTLKV
jgi:3-oxoacyl-[acyl-carrier protein] reductase